MTDNFVRRLVLKFVLQVLLSAMWAALTTIAAGIVVLAASETDTFIGDILQLLLRSGSSVVWGIAAFILFYIGYLVLYQYGRYRYYARMIAAVREIAGGRFDVAVPVNPKDDFGVLAGDMNTLIARLRNSIEEERRAEQTKNELITNVSHDLRTPLTSILGYLGLIDDDKYRDEVELRHYVQIAHAKAKRLHVLINDLFEYTRMRHDGMAMRMTPFRLTELLGQLLTQYRLGLEETGMTATLRVPDGTALELEGDPDKLVRVFENLLTNAMRYGRDGKRIDVNAKTEGDEAVVDVVNYGEPIDASDLPHIFDRFYRADKSRTEAGDEGAAYGRGGSGLGLAIAKGIVEKHGGTIAAYSDARSTVFQVRLPLTRGPRPSRS